MTLFEIVLLVGVVGLAAFGYLLYTHKISMAQVQAELARAHDKLDHIIHRNTANDAAPPAQTAPIAAQPVPVAPTPPVDHVALAGVVLRGAEGIVRASLPQPSPPQQGAPMNTWNPEPMIDAGTLVKATADANPNGSQALWRRAGAPPKTLRENPVDNLGWPIVNGVEYTAGGGAAPVDDSAFQAGSVFDWSNPGRPLVRDSRAAPGPYPLTVPSPDGWAGILELRSGQMQGGAGGVLWTCKDKDGKVLYDNLPDAAFPASNGPFSVTATFTDPPGKESLQCPHQP